MQPCRHSPPHLLPLYCTAQLAQLAKAAAVLEVLADLVHLVEEVLPCPDLPHPQHPARELLHPPLLLHRQLHERLGFRLRNNHFLLTSSGDLFAGTAHLALAPLDLLHVQIEYQVMQQNTSLSLPLPRLLLAQLHPLAHLHQFGHVEAVHVMHVRVDPARLPEVDMIPLIYELDQPLLAHLHLYLHDLHVPLLERVVHHLLVLQRRDRTGRVDHRPAHPRAVNRSQDQLLLDVGVLVDVQKQPVRLYRVVLRNNAQTRTGRIQQHSIERPREDERVLAAIAAGDHRVGDAQPKKVEPQRLQAFLLEVVGKDAARVLHQLRNVGGLPPGGRGHVEHPLAHLGVEGEHGQEGGGALQHVVPRQVLGSGTDRHLRFVDLDAHLAPLGQGVQVGPALDQTLRQFFSSGLEGVGADGERALRFVGLEELDQFGGVEEVEEVVDEFKVIPVVLVQQPPQLLDVVLARLALAQLGDVHEDVDRLLDLQVHHTDVHWLVVLLFILLLEGRSIAVHLFILALALHLLGVLVLFVFVVVFLVEVLA